MSLTIRNLVEAKATAVQTILKGNHSSISIVETITGGQLSAFLSSDPACFGGGYLLTPRCYDILGITRTIASASPQKLISVMGRNCLSHTRTDWALALIAEDAEAYLCIAHKQGAEIYSVRLCPLDSNLQLCSTALSLLLISLGNP